ncbi:MAG: hypothetical protein LBC90_03065 [Candidatus Adiutrix sp.]|jgi:hypothetical protein|nr:hypothetical protein [Candidatus Adiutrix sp.]
MTARPPGRGLDLVLAALISGAALTGLVRVEAPTAPPPGLPSGPATYRQDGGQMLGPAGPLPPNALTRLNLGRQVDLPTTPTHLLAALPGLGPKTAEKARGSGCLDSRARASLKELVNEACTRNSP